MLRGIWKDGDFMKKTMKGVFALVSVCLTALSVSEALKKEEEIEKELKQN